MTRSGGDKCCISAKVRENDEEAKKEGDAKEIGLKEKIYPDSAVKEREIKKQKIQYTF